MHGAYIGDCALQAKNDAAHTNAAARRKEGGERRISWENKKCDTYLSLPSPAALFGTSIAPGSLHLVAHHNTWSSSKGRRRLAPKARDDEALRVTAKNLWNTSRKATKI